MAFYSISSRSQKKYLAALHFINRQMNESQFHGMNDFLQNNTTVNNTLPNFEVVLIRQNEIRHHFPQRIRDCFGHCLINHVSKELFVKSQWPYKAQYL